MATQARKPHSEVPTTPAVAVDPSISDLAARVAELERRLAEVIHHCGHQPVDAS
ncbi:MAG: hypothetical protein PHQ28_10065 [Mycobacterium sp.]|jgi:hypothetical protein|nr:hypothetical protein [Mycobacterium sp.]